MQALWLRRAGDSPNVEGATGPAAAYLAFYRAELLGHFADEEEVLLPLAGHADPEGASRIRSEHRELRAFTAKLSDVVSAGGDPRSLAREIGQLLDDHVRLEERSFFMAVQAHLSPAELAALERALQGHREARGVVLDCAVPVRTTPTSD
jgi:hemerythrin-like domain-containing protein